MSCHARARTRMNETGVMSRVRRRYGGRLPHGAGEPVNEFDWRPFEHPSLSAMESHVGSGSTLERVHDRGPHAGGALTEATP